MSGEFRWMGVALDAARQALDKGEVPIGCVFVADDQEIARAANETNATMNPTRHAELVALCSQVYDWSRCDVYVTCEPCIMCASALEQVGVRRVVFGCHNDKFGGCGSILDCRFDFVAGCRKDEAVALLRRFYERGNQRTSSKRPQ